MTPPARGGPTGGPGAARARTRVVFHGQVQGVFFRATSCEIARRFAVTGWVRNRPDGTVELEAEGATDQVHGLIDAIREHFAGNITRCVESSAPVLGNETTFVIRY